MCSVTDPNLNIFHQQNPNFDLRSFRFNDPRSVAALNWKGLDEPRILEDLKQQRRMLNLDPDPAIADALSFVAQPHPMALAAAGGVASPQPAPPTSAHAIASLSRSQFVETYAPRLPGDGVARANQIYDNAVGIQANVANQLANISQLRTPYTKASVATNAAVTIADHYGSSPSYADLFGGLNYCHCDECKSIFGPAAYFVDLMRIADQYATQPNLATIPHGMSLAERRPDLALIRLSCENTNRVMPYLSIVNVRLEATVKQALAITGDLYQALAQRPFPLQLPFQLPLACIRIYLRQLTVGLADIYAALEPGNDTAQHTSAADPVFADQASQYRWAAEALGISNEEWNLITQKQADKTKLAAQYGVDDVAKLSDASVFCKQTNLLPTAVQDLLRQNLSATEVTAALHRQFFINTGLANPIALQLKGDSEQIVNLATDPMALDQVYRFVRLAGKLGWSNEDLDWALHYAAAGTPSINNDTLVVLARLEGLSKRCAVPIKSVLALLFDLKTYGSGDGTNGSAAAFDQAFNKAGTKPYRPKDHAAASYKFNPSYTDDLNTWSVGATDPRNASLASWVAAGIGLRQDDLLILAQRLFTPPAGPNVELTVGNLSLLARNVSLALLIGLPIQQYVKLLELLSVAAAPTIESVSLLREQAARLRRGGMTVFELDYIVTGNADPSVDILYRRADLGTWLDSLPGQVQAQAAPDARAKQVTGLVASFLGARPDQIEALFPFTGKGDIAGLFLDSGSRTDAVKTVQALSGLMVMVRKLQLSNDEIVNIRSAHLAYGISSLQTLSAGNVLDIFRMKQIRASYGDDAGHFLNYLGASGDDIANALAALTSQPVDQIKLVLPLFAYANRILQFERLQRVLKLMQLTGMDFASLNRLRDLVGGDAAAKWGDYNSAAAAVLAAVRTRLGGSDWDSLYQQLDGQVQECKRTALIGTAINALAQRDGTIWINNSRNLYEYLLIDVEMGGTTTISTIKEGLNAIQLYLLRCRERLEPGIANFAIPTVWWEWMMNYRIWEANRKIFVYPESYFDPALRASKTKLFIDLENTLKQGDIDGKTVETAFTKYLDRFAELAKLCYVDACYYNVSDDAHADVRTMFFVARTETQPWKYFYTTCQIGDTDRVWSEWQEISITINSDCVTPIYAFNRLFLFWVEQRQYDDRSGSGTTSSFKTVIKATIKYSFYNFSGEWVQAQTLVADAIISEGNSDVVKANAATFPDSLFDPQRMWWKKVYPLKIERALYGVAGLGANKFEKIVLFYGPTLDIAACATPVNVKNVPAVDSLELDFEARLNETLAALRQAKDGGYVGYLPVFPPIVVNNDLNRGFLVNPNEFLLLQKENPKSRHYVRPEIDRSAGLLSLLPTDHIILDNYQADGLINPTAVTAPAAVSQNCFVSTAAGIDGALSDSIYSALSIKGYIGAHGILAPTIGFAQLRSDLKAALSGQPDPDKKTESVVAVIGQAAGTPCLSNAMRHQDYTLFTVKNHPAAFVFSGDKEAFLLAPKGAMPAISRAALNPDLLLAENTFVSAAVNIDATGSRTIYQLLIDSGFADANGQLDAQLDVDDLRSELKDQLRNDDQAAAVVNLVTQAPMFRPDAFVAGDPTAITLDGSKAIFDQLAEQGYLDKNGRLDADVDFHDLMDSVNSTLQGQPAQALKVRFVVDILYQRASPSSVGFFDTSPAVNPFEYNFEAVRLTTAAVHNLSSLLFTGGIDSLLDLRTQQIPLVPELPFGRFQFSPGAVTAPVAIDGAQVDFWGTYKLYYWELFFHAPLTVANLLKANQQFEAAEHWYRYIFDPTVPIQPIGKDAFVSTTIGARDSARIYQALLDAKIITADGAVSGDFAAETDLSKTLNFLGNSEQIETARNVLLNQQLSAPTARFWQFRPFRNHTLETLRAQLTNGDEIDKYNSNPFDPDAIAALRIGAYEKAVVMQYADNLLQWGDQLFSQYTWESIVAATMLYVSAYNLLGERPEDLGAQPPPPAMTFQDLLQKFHGKIPQFLLDLEAEQVPGARMMTFAPINAFDTYFCVPENSDFVGYWDRVEDRLYKIRHGLNIKGIPQVLALFEPPIDPHQLVRAAAAGGDVLSRLSGQDANVIYRFSFMIERARQLASAASSLGQALLAALEKKDAEALARLRATQENAILDLTTLMKQKQVDETRTLIEATQESRNSAQRRHDFYASSYDENLNALEIIDLTLRSASLPLQVAAIGTRGISIAGYLSPSIFGLADGGMQWGDAVSSIAQILDGGSAILNQSAGLIGTGAQYVRRRDDWGLQRDVAQYELNQLDKQIAASQSRLDLLNRELATHLKSIDQANEYESFLKRKFTNQELYQWMVGRLLTLHFQTYRLALDMAFAAQTVYRRELDATDQFVGFDYWDSLHQGLLAGDALLFVLNQMEAAYIAANSRTYEIEKTISLLQLDPVGFIKFKGGIDGATKGELPFTLSEALFDFDFPGHYCRKIKAVTVSIPAVIGPYQNLNAMLTQTKNSIVLKPKIAAVKFLLDGIGNPPDGSIGSAPAAQPIALSRGVNDSGLFVLDFGDQRFLPFEGTGAVSSWLLSLPPDTNRIDFGTISDVIVKVQYTAKDDGTLADDVKKALFSAQPPYPYTPAKVLDLRQAFAADWSRLLNQPAQAGIQSIGFTLTDRVILPNLKNVMLKSADILLLTADGSVVSDGNAGSFIGLKIGDSDVQKVKVANNHGNVDLSGMTPKGTTCSLSFTIANLPGTLLANGALNPAVLANVVVVITYQSNVFSN